MERRGVGGCATSDAELGQGRSRGYGAGGGEAIDMFHGNDGGFHGAGFGFKPDYTDSGARGRGFRPRGARGFAPRRGGLAGRPGRGAAAGFRGGQQRWPSAGGRGGPILQGAGSSSSAAAGRHAPACGSIPGFETDEEQRPISAGSSICKQMVPPIINDQDINQNSLLPDIQVTTMSSVQAMAVDSLQAIGNFANEPSVQTAGEQVAGVVSKAENEVQLKSASATISASSVRAAVVGAPAVRVHNVKQSKAGVPIKPSPVLHAEPSAGSGEETGARNSCAAAWSVAIMAAAGIKEASSTHHTSPRLGAAADEKIMDKAMKRTAARNLDQGAGNFQGGVLDANLVFAASEGRRIQGCMLLETVIMEVFARFR